MSRRKLTATLAAGVVVISLVFFFLRTHEHEEPLDGQDVAVSEPQAAPSTPTVGANAADSPEASFRRTPAQVTAREERLSALREARQRRISRHAPPPSDDQHQNERLEPENQGDAGAAPPVPPQHDIGSLDREYIQEAIHDMQPLIQECYELARDEEPSLEGRLLVEFVVGGEPDVGGIIEEAGVAASSGGESPLLRDCIRETVYTLELPAPEGGGQVTVRYPFQFSSAPDSPQEP